MAIAIDPDNETYKESKQSTYEFKLRMENLKGLPLAREFLNKNMNDLPEKDFLTGTKMLEAAIDSQEYGFETQLIDAVNPEKNTKAGVSNIEIELLKYEAIKLYGVLGLKPLIKL